MAQYRAGGFTKEFEEVEPEYFKTNTLGAKLGNTLLGFFKRAVNSITGWFEERLINFLIHILERIETGGAEIFKKLIEDLEKKGAIPENFKPIFDEIKSPKHEIGAFLSASAGQATVGGLLGTLTDPITMPIKELVQYALVPYTPEISHLVYGKINEIIEDDRYKDLMRSKGFSEDWFELFYRINKNQITLENLIALKNRGAISESEFDERLKMLGFDDDDRKLLFYFIYRIPDLTVGIQNYFRGKITRAELEDLAEKNGIKISDLDLIINSNRRLIELADIRSIYFRENKSEEWLTNQLKKLGYDDTSITELKTIFPYFPSVPDLIRFAVREVYTPDIVSRYGMMEDLPGKYLEEARKAGLPEDQAKNYWASHWELPSATQGFEMLHRGVITYEELKTLLRTLDVMPYWREKLIQIAYTPLTRVDVRRMYNMGILSEEEVFTAYKHLGYNDENARYMTDFTIKYYQQADKNLTRSNIQDGYKRKYFTKEEAISLLKELGYDDTEAEFYIAKVDYDEEVERKKDLLKLLESAYKKDVYTDNEIIEILSDEGFQASEIDYHLTKWSIAKKVKGAKPDKSELKTWLVKKVISRDKFIEEMRSLGFADKYIDLYLKELTGRGL